MLLITVALAVCAALAYYMGPGGTGVIGQLTLEDNSDFKVIQRHNYCLEPYTIDFYFRLPGSPWGWCYIEHEDTRWSFAVLLEDLRYAGRTLRKPPAFSLICGVIVAAKMPREAREMNLRRSRSVSEKSAVMQLLSRCAYRAVAGRLGAVAVAASMSPLQLLIAA